MAIPRGSDEEEATEKTPLYYQLPSPSSTNKPSEADSVNDEEHSVASLEIDLPYANKEGSFVGGYGACLESKTGKVVAVLLILLATTLALVRSPSSPLPDTPSSGKGTKDDTGKIYVPPLPFSYLDPVLDLNLYGFDRASDSAPPDTVRRENSEALPTNQWYQNFLLNRGHPTEVTRVYTVPYMLDVVGPIPGITLHPNHIMSTSTVIQLSFVQPHGLSLGCAVNTKHDSTKKLNHQYSVMATTPLGITLQWNASQMTSSIVRGMPYGTMIYPPTNHDDEVLPTIAFTGLLRGQPIADGKTRIKCDTGEEFLVERELQMTLDQSDFTWIAFFSQPVLVHCVGHHEGGGAALQFHTDQDSDEELIARVALKTNCTLGRNPLYCDGYSSDSNTDDYLDLLRKHADVYPGSKTSVRYEIDHELDSATVTLDWDVQTMSGDAEPGQLISFALPHQLDYLETSGEFCHPALLGRSCLVKGSTWVLPQTLPPVSFRAARPPRPEAVPALSEALQKDFGLEVPDNYMRGAGDTYFSGKILAKAARILVIADEVKELCTKPTGRLQLSDPTYSVACRNSTVPSIEEDTDLLNMLRAGVEIWINGSAESPFVYDKGWGGLVSCGCYFNGDTGSCDNKFPDCPAFSDPGLNFGNGFYNDHHFHYGYHIYAAAAVAKFDPEWGRTHFEEVKLLIRDFANPSPDDSLFPFVRHKDWYEGHSWASGIPLPAYLNGRNQESSSEAIASYEAVALFGKVMVDAFQDCPHCQDPESLQVAKEIRNVGRLLLATEIRSTDRYWHVRQKNESTIIYPKSYTKNVVGMLWNTMAQFQTWFGNAPYLPYGIQLLPITAISEQRDDPLWLQEMYAPFADACNLDRRCEDDGWSVLQLSTLAAVGHFGLALKRALALSSDVFSSAGGNGHSRSNTLWYIATRPDVVPIPLPKSDETTVKVALKDHQKDLKLVDCGLPDTCTDKELDADAGGFTCRERINWLMDSIGDSQSRACSTIGLQFPDSCDACNPGPGSNEGIEESSQCPPCSNEACYSELNRCPVFGRTFLCTRGANSGGCQATPWPEEPPEAPMCLECCETTRCPKKFVAPVTKTIDPSLCPPCGPEICSGSLNMCNVNSAPYLCTEGAATAGCSAFPWDLKITAVCTDCCIVTDDCYQTQQQLLLLLLP